MIRGDTPTASCFNSPEQPTHRMPAHSWRRLPLLYRGDLVICKHSAQSWSKNAKTGQMHCDDCDADIEHDKQCGFWCRRAASDIEKADDALTEAELAAGVAVEICDACGAMRAVRIGRTL